MGELCGGGRIYRLQDDNVVIVYVVAVVAHTVCMCGINRKWTKGTTAPVLLASGQGWRDQATPRDHECWMTVKGKPPSATLAQ